MYSWPLGPVIFVGVRDFMWQTAPPTLLRGILSPLSVMIYFDHPWAKASRLQVDSWSCWVFRWSVPNGAYVDRVKCHKMTIFLTPSISGGCHTQMGSLGSNRAKPRSWGMVWYTYRGTKHSALDVHVPGSGAQHRWTLLDAIGCYCWHGKTTKL
jgi:hypothetical protein